jgi:hypothetical protein
VSMFKPKRQDGPLASNMLSYGMVCVEGFGRINNKAVVIMASIASNDTINGVSYFSVIIENWL